MKKFLLASTALMIAAPALAADLPRRSAAIAPAPIMVSMNWTGFYVGLNVGYVAADKLAFGPGNLKLDGFTAGARLGYDWQVNQNWVIGAFADVDAGFASDTILGVKVKTPFLASLNVRAGYLITPATLLYALAGYQYVDVKISAPFALPPGLPGSADGYTVGLGLEHRYTQNWSVFIEGRYNDVRMNNAIPGIARNVDAFSVKAGVNYRFGGAAAPVVARY